MINLFGPTFFFAAWMVGQWFRVRKQQRVEELMLVQQEVAFAKAKAMKGKTIEVLIERLSTARSPQWYDVMRKLLIVP